ncbi:MAG: DHHW family protein [Eubacteriales bacterium]|jgi:hypothetical protein
MAWYRKKRVYRLLLLVLCGVCTLLLIVFGALAILLPKATVSEAEKRELAQRPAFSWEALFDGTWTRDFELYYADTFPFRDGFVRLTSKIENLTGVRPDDIRIVGDTSALTKPTTGKATTAATVPTAPAVTTRPTSDPTEPSGAAEPPSTSVTHGVPPMTTTEPTTTAATEPTTTVPDDAVAERSGAVIICADRAFEIFGGSEKQKYLYADVISAYAKRFADCRVFSIVVPTSIAFYLPEKYADYSADEHENIEAIYGALDAKVISVDAYSVLEEHRAEYIYFNTDHHWTGLGAYYAYTAFAKEAGFAPIPYADYEKNTITGFKGTLAASTNDARLLSNLDTVEYCYIPVKTTTYRWEKGATKGDLSSVLAEYAKGSNAYGVFLHGDCPRIDIRNEENPNGKNALVLKESYGNAFAPYLIPNYANVHIIDERYFTGSIQEFVKEHEIDDIIIINNIFAANTSTFATKLTGLLDAQ